MSVADLTEEGEQLATAIATRVLKSGQTVAVAESLTSGNLASHLGAAPDASKWFAGGVVAYAAEVKFQVLDVEPGPVVTAKCAGEMARGVVRLLGSDLGVSITGVGGPDPEEGHPAGTVFIAVSTGHDETVTEHHLDGDPAQVVSAAAVEALKLLLAALKP
ncbi:CinA family protein [Kribbella deserti]|uniref:CinA family protein n=1 Tax=Kribbella deserti TaxID=1926257 RepID=A0ABV6QG47_9ACTN